MKKWILFLCIVFFSGCFTHAQTGSIKGVIIDEMNEPVRYIKVFLIKDNVKIDQSNTNAKGEYYFYSTPAGKYELFIDGSSLPYYGMVHHTEKKIVVKKEQVLLKNIQVICTHKDKIYCHKDTLYIMPYSDKKQMKTVRKFNANKEYYPLKTDLSSVNSTTTGQNQICIKVHVDTSGNVIDARIIYDITVNDKKYTTTTTNPDILNACIEKVKSVKYQPGKDEYRIIIFR